MDRFSLGWQRELPDFRDWDITKHPMAQPLMAGGVSAEGMVLQAQPSSVDLRQHCSPIENQGMLGSCTAQAAVGMVEYLEKRYKGIHVDGSRLFVYKVTRNLLGWTGDTGAYVRTTMKALAKLGVPPEKFWPHDILQFDKEPTAFVYSLASTARALKYFRLDKELKEGDLLELVKLVTARGWPTEFGFVVYSWGNEDGEFPMPDNNSRPYGGHAVVCVGYDDKRVIGDSQGAFLIRNSWGTLWGDKGYGWLPYDYLLKGLTADWWTVFSQDFIGD